MKKRHIIIIACVAVMALIICGIVFGPKIFGTSPGEPTVVPTPTEIALTTETPTLPPSETPVPVPSPTETSVPTESPTPTPTEEVTPSPTEEPTPEPTEEPTPTEEPLPTDSPTPVPTNTATPVPTKEPTKVPTNVATPVPTKEPTKEPTKAPTNTPTPVPTPEQPYDMWVRVLEPTVFSAQSSGYILNEIDRNGLKLGDKVTVVKSNFNGAPDGQDCLMEIKWGSGTALMWKSELSKSFVEPVWPEPRERTDIANALARLIDNYRAQNGIRKVENPYIYYELDNPGIGDYLTSKALRVAKRCCMEGTANHEGGQIGTGIYGGAHDAPMNAEECANALFQNWYNSPAHRANLLDNKDADTLVLVGTVKVVEWYNGYGYQYCAIQGISYVEKAKLPDGLE